MAPEKEKQLVDMGVKVVYTSVKVKDRSRIDAFARYLKEDMISNLRERLRSNLAETPLVDYLERFEKYYQERLAEEASAKAKMGLLSRLTERIFGSKDAVQSLDPHSLMADKSTGLNLQRDYVGELEHAITKNIFAKLNREPEFAEFKQMNFVSKKALSEAAYEKIKAKVLNIPKAASPNLKREMANDIVLDVFKSLAEYHLANARSQKELIAIKNAFTQFIRAYTNEKLKDKDLMAINSFIQNEESRRQKELFEQSPEARKIRREYERILALIYMKNQEILARETQGLKKLRFVFSSLCSRIGLNRNNVAQEMQKIKEEVQREHSRSTAGRMARMMTEIQRPRMPEKNKDPILIPIQVPDIPLFNASDSFQLSGKKNSAPLFDLPDRQDQIQQTQKTRAAEQTVYLGR